MPFLLSRGRFTEEVLQETRRAREKIARDLVVLGVLVLDLLDAVAVETEEHGSGVSEQDWRVG